MVASKKKIFRIVIGDTKKKLIGFKLVEGKSAKEILNKPKSKFVGRGRTVIGVIPTRLKGTLKQRGKLPRSKRFGKGFE